MTTLAMFHPTHLVASELREVLDRRRELWQKMHLLSNREQEIGTLTEVRGEAAVVAAVDDSSFDGVDVAFFFGPAADYAPLLQNLPDTTTAVVVGQEPSYGDGLPVVSGLNLDQVSTTSTLLSPHPAVIAGALLLQRWATLKPVRWSATVLQPASVFGNDGLDELLEQTRAMLNFQTRDEDSPLPSDLAFNVFQNPDGVDGILGPLGTLMSDHLQQPCELSCQVLQTSVFHGFGIAMQVEFAQDPGEDALAQALEDHPSIDLDVPPHGFGPKQAVAQDKMMVGTPNLIRPGVYSLWTSLDNLTVGGAANLMAILEALSPQLTEN